MDQIKSMKVFVAVAEQRNFAKVAEQFNLSATMVGKHIRSLEHHLGTSLISRTTRRQTLTEAGRFYLGECRQLLDKLQQVEAELQQITKHPRGLVRVNVPVNYGNLVIAPLMAELMASHPEIDIELQLDNARITINEQVDVLIRIGELAETALVVRRIGDYPLCYCASPVYLEKHGIPLTPKELSKHHCLGFDGGSGQRLLPRPRLTTNSGNVLMQAALDHAGVILQPKLLLQEPLQQGRLVEILTDFVPAPMPINLLYQSRQQPLKNRAVIDFLIRRLRQ
ncbi:LysR family transcriptional regulator [Ferrimonas sp. SCSIO 43195]|uniref:LysR family transcriptional regulator n=1 Tax=Ferrimonas sp. SCSIO 43195 TaxID=2822844 RepID=UPI00207516CC|nr:LysR family transcriptional regulator [Ferrimonas sp. SCSIO 43195]USD39263.1 LysR family transcriptional regulator [Ferrimonas sp. SCSIO 43195]